MSCYQAEAAILAAEKERLEAEEAERRAAKERRVGFHMNFPWWFGMQCDVHDMLRVRYAMSGSDIGDGATRKRERRDGRQRGRGE
eukprot:1678554-Rhodomonas_salina.4